MRFRHVVGVLAIMLIAIPAIASARSASDLRVIAALDPPSVLPPGASFSAAATIANIGGARTPTTQTSFYLSRDAKTPQIKLASIRTPRLNPRQTIDRWVTFSVPQDTAKGEYYLIVCADTTHRAHEGNEKNNCITSASAVGIQPFR